MIIIHIDILIIHRYSHYRYSYYYHLVGLVVKVSASKAEDPVFDSRLPLGDFYGPSHTSDVHFGTPVAARLGAWWYGATGWSGVSIL